jgi:hypothetical protein
MTREVSGLKAEVSTLSEGGKAIVDKVQNLEAQLKQATQMIYSFEPLLNTFNKIANTTEGQELIKKIHEAKLNQETVEAQNEANKHKAEITKENPIQNKVKRE